MSNKINKQDYFYGIFLSRVIENGRNPILIEKDKERGIFELITNKNNYKVYIKYAVIEKDKKTWDFNFSKRETLEIEELNMELKNKEELIFAYVCAYKNLLNTEIIISDLKDFKKCINTKCIVNESFRISINKKSGSPNLNLYGTIKDLKDAIKIPRYKIDEL